MAFNNAGGCEFEPRRFRQILRIKMSAYSQALALESIPFWKKWDGDSYNGVTPNDLEQFAKTIAYKVAHNLRNGHKMDYSIDPLDYGGGNPHYEIIIWKHNNYPKIIFFKK